MLANTYAKVSFCWHIVLQKLAYEKLFKEHFVTIGIIQTHNVHYYTMISLLQLFCWLHNMTHVQVSLVCRVRQSPAYFPNNS